MRRLLIGIGLVAAIGLLPVPSAFAQFGGFGPSPFGGYGGSPYGGFGASPFGFEGMPFGGFGAAQTPFGFGGQGGPGGFGGPGGPPPNLQVCTDSQGNRVLVSNGSSTSSYTGCAAASTTGSPPTNVTQACTDSLGNRVLVIGSNATTGYTSCGSPPPPPGQGGPGGPGGFGGPGPRWGPSGGAGVPLFPR
jgi:hypothetical protein